jgi:hypothetical protein
VLLRLWLFEEEIQAFGGVILAGGGWGGGVCVFFFVLSFGVLVLGFYFWGSST